MLTCPPKRLNKLDEDFKSLVTFFSPVRLGSIPELPAKSCKEIKSSEGEDLVSDYYWILFVRLGEVVQAFCDMLSEGKYCL